MPWLSSDVNVLIPYFHICIDTDIHGRPESRASAQHVPLDTVAVQERHPAAALPQDSRGNTPLHVAAAAGHAPAVRSLLARARSPRPRNALLRTPLALALDRGHSPVISAFVEFLMTPPLRSAATAAAETAAAAPRPRGRVTGGRWARHAMRDDVAEAQISRMTQEVRLPRSAALHKVTRDHLA